MLPRRAKVDLGAMAIKGYSAFPKECWNLTIRLFSVILGHSLGGGGLTPLQRCSRCILHQAKFDIPFNKITKPKQTQANQYLMRGWLILNIYTRVMNEWSGRPGFNPRSRHTRDLKMILDTSLLNTQQYKVRIQSKVEESWERSSALPNTSVL